MNNNNINININNNVNNNKRIYKIYKKNYIKNIKQSEGKRQKQAIPCSQYNIQPLKCGL